MVDSHSRPSAEQAAVVGWIAGLGAVTAAALAEHIAVRIASARARLNRLCALGLLARHDLLKGRPAVYTASPMGLRRCAIHDLDPCRVSPSGIRHLAVCSEVAARLECCYPGLRLAGERELRREERMRGAPLGSCRLDRRSEGLEGLHRPDLVLWPATLSGGPATLSGGPATLCGGPATLCGGGPATLCGGVPAGARARTRGQPVESPHPFAEDPRPLVENAQPLSGELPVAVEIELTVKAPDRLAAICVAWARCREVAGTIYLVAPEAQGAVERAIQRARAERRVALLPLACIGPADPSGWLGGP